MAYRNTILRILRGIFAALIAMSVVVSSSVHAATSGDDGVVVAAGDSHELHPESAHGDHDGWTKSTPSAAAKAPGTGKGGCDNGSLCKLLCSFSMIAPFVHGEISGHGRAPWATMPIVAMLPGEPTADIRPPRS
jgi:hypothetical protein